MVDMVFSAPDYDHQRLVLLCYCDKYPSSTDCNHYSFPHYASDDPILKVYVFSSIHATVQMFVVVEMK